MTPVSTPHLHCFSQIPSSLNKSEQRHTNFPTSRSYLQTLRITCVISSTFHNEKQTTIRCQRTKCSRPGFVHLCITALTGHYWNHISLHMDILAVKLSGNMATFIPILYMIEQKIYYFQQTWRLQYRLILPATAVYYCHLTLLFTNTLRQVFFPFFHTFFTFLFIPDLFCRFLLYISLSLSH